MTRSTINSRSIEGIGSIDATGTVTAAGLTVDTDTLHIDSTNNRVGIGDSSPSAKLVLRDSSDFKFVMSKTGASAFEIANNGTSGTALTVQDGYPLIFGTNNTERMRIDSSGNVGIGTASPLRKLHVSNSGAEGFEFGPGNASDQNQILHYNRSTSSYIENNNRAGSHTWDIISTEAMRIDSSGNVGIGVTPSAWSVSGVLQSGRVSLSGGANATGGTLNWNAYYDGSWKYKDSLEASQYNFTNGQHVWSYAASGTADGAITWSEAMRIDSSGRVGIGDTSPVYNLVIRSDSSTALSQTDVATYNKAFMIKNATSGADTSAMIVFATETNGELYLGGVQGADNNNSNLQILAREGGSRRRITRFEHDGGAQVGNYNFGTSVTNHPGTSSNTSYFLGNGNLNFAGNLFIGFTVYFPHNVSNLAIRLYNNLYSWWGSGEIIIASSYSNAPAQGFRRYLFTHNRNTTSNYGDAITNTDNFGSTSSHFELNSQGYDTGEGAHYWEFRHIASSGNPLRVQMRLFGNAGDNISSPYPTGSADWYIKHTTY